MAGEEDALLLSIGVSAESEGEGKEVLEEFAVIVGRLEEKVDVGLTVIVSNTTTVEVITLLYFFPPTEKFPRWNRMRKEKDGS